MPRNMNPMAGPNLRALRRVTGPKPRAMDPSKAVMAAPRIKATSTREYGKGGTPYSGGPDMGVRGAGIGFGGGLGFDPNVSQ
jgi:hypothetical protein